MRYRVQYMAANERRTAEVEATSPHEAVIKFRHISSEGRHQPGQSAEVLSVSPQPEMDDVAWREP